MSLINLANWKAGGLVPESSDNQYSDLLRRRPAVHNYAQLCSIMLNYAKFQRIPLVLTFFIIVPALVEDLITGWPLLTQLDIIDSSLALLTRFWPLPTLFRPKLRLFRPEVRTSETDENNVKQLN